MMSLCVRLHCKEVCLLMHSFIGLQCMAIDPMCCVVHMQVLRYCEPACIGVGASVERPRCCHIRLITMSLRALIIGQASTGHSMQDTQKPGGGWLAAKADSRQQTRAANTSKQLLLTEVAIAELSRAQCSSTVHAQTSTSGRVAAGLSKVLGLQPRIGRPNQTAPCPSDETHGQAGQAVSWASQGPEPPAPG